ncbi:MAG: hypothetical protein OXC07_08225 [Kistimonas sp.]|nr:hypothetical protein [Kistimonas sp.]
MGKAVVSPDSTLKALCTSKCRPHGTGEPVRQVDLQNMPPARQDRNF